MGQVLIRNLDDETIAAYREAAARNERSLEAELRFALKVLRPTTQVQRDEAARRLDALREQTRGRDHTPSAILVREIRDA